MAMKNKQELDIVHFTLKEFVISATAVKNGLCNIPSFEAVSNLRKLCAFVLERIRSYNNLPMTITSGYRSTKVNELVGGASNSFHTMGMAADFTLPASVDLADLFDLIKFDMPWLTECIYYPDKRFIHVAYNENSLKHYFAIKK